MPPTHALPSRLAVSLARLSRRLRAPAEPPPAPWSAPPLPDLVRRIDAALAERRAGAG